MRKTTKRMIQATMLGVGGFLIAIIFAFLGMRMWLSGTFLPVYVKGVYVIGNQLLRYFLYLVIFVIFLLSTYVACIGWNYLWFRLKRAMKR